jgi:hypothetical protein
MAYAELADNKVKLAELPACDTISPAKYEDLGIPSGATAVIGGSDEQESAYLCAVPGADGQVAFFLGAAEGNEKPSFNKVAIFADGRFQILRPLGAGDLAGF